MFLMQITEGQYMSAYKETINHLYQQQKQNKWKQSLTDAKTRIQLLQKLKSVIVSHEQEIKSALYADFQKPHPETELTEIYTVLEEIKFITKNLHKWMKNQKVSTPLALLGTRSEIRFEAKGQVLVMAPWNYPFQLALGPVAAALAAGNVCILRPSEKTPHTTAIIKKIVEATFANNIVAVVDGGIETAEHLLTLGFDHIFFTGSTQVGKKVMSAAANHLTSVTLELGGKSPTIVHEDAQLDEACKRIVWAKYLNAGQTCIAPDYIFVHKNIYEKFVSKVKARIQEVFGDNPEQSESFARIVDQTGLRRLAKLTAQTVEQGATYLTPHTETNEEKKYFPPTVIGNIQPQHPLMQEEIFGPIMPILTYQNLDEVIQYIQANDKPLALYIYCSSKAVYEKVIRNTTSGGAVWNHSIIHLANPNLPFGGVGPSGLGNYHGHFGFKTFSHERAILRQGPLAIADSLFPPYTNKLFTLTIQFLRWLTR